MKTAVEWLCDQVNTFLTNDQKKILKNVFDKAEGMDKEQRKIIQIETLNLIQSTLDGNNTEENNLWHRINGIKKTLKNETRTN